MNKKSWGTGLAVMAAALVAPLTIVAEATSASAAINHQATQRAASTDPVNLQARLYPVPSGRLASNTAWDCFDVTGAPNSRFICTQLAVLAPSFTPSS